jgi:hypothetical protein
VLTSRAFVERARLESVVEALAREVKIVWLDDVRADIALGDKLRGVLRGSRPQVRRSPDDPAVILFTSGSEGAPKGVVLSHRNIMANAAQALARVDANSADKVFNVLPVFHSFGLTGGLIMPLLAGVPVFLYPSPLHYRIVPELIYITGATIAFGTDTFLSGYARSAHPYDFRTLRLLVAGAEPVKPQTRTVYMEQFGVRILEGYGVTEVAPVAAMNTPMANRPGTVGRLSPLMEARLEPVEGVEDGGRLHLKGPNVMLGYLKADNPGVIEPPPDGWHDTGDIVSIDADGFITILGRAKRFAKVAGEMVSLAAAESLAGEVWPEADCAVVAVPDRRKGERLVLVTTARGARRDALVSHARARGAGELVVPADIITLRQAARPRHRQARLHGDQGPGRRHRSTEELLQIALPRCVRPAPACGPRYLWSSRIRSDRVARVAMSCATQGRKTMTNRRFTGWKSWLGAAAAVLLLSGTPATQAQDDQTITIGIVTFLSGGAAGPFGVPARNAAELVVEAINNGNMPAPYDTPGIAGAKIRTVIIDEAGGTPPRWRTAQSDRARKRRSGHRLYFQRRLPGRGPVAEELKRLTVLFDCGTPRIFEEAEYRYVFRTGPHATMDNVSVARYILDRDPDISTIAGINQNYAWGQDSWQDFKEAMIALKPDITVTTEQFPQLFAGQYGGEISALLVNPPDVVHSSFWGADLEAFILQGVARACSTTVWWRFGRRARDVPASQANPRRHGDRSARTPWRARSRQRAQCVVPSRLYGPLRHPADLCLLQDGDGPAWG